jgi:hypothetical protein
VQVSVDGGADPRWSADGTRLYYRSGTRLISATLGMTPSPHVVKREAVANGVEARASARGTYAVSRDGAAVLLIKSDRDDFQLVVVPDWLPELRRRLQSNRR